MAAWSVLRAQGHLQTSLFVLALPHIISRISDNMKCTRCRLFCFPHAIFRPASESLKGRPTAPKDSSTSLTYFLTDMVKGSARNYLFLASVILDGLCMSRLARRRAVSELAELASDWLVSLADELELLRLRLFSPFFPRDLDSYRHRASKALIGSLLLPSANLARSAGCRAFPPCTCGPPWPGWET